MLRVTDFFNNNPSTFEPDLKRTALTSSRHRGIQFQRSVTGINGPTCTYYLFGTVTRGGDMPIDKHVDLSLAADSRLALSDPTLAAGSRLALSDPTLAAGGRLALSDPTLAAGGRLALSDPTLAAGSRLAPTRPQLQGKAADIAGGPEGSADGSSG